MAVTTSSPSLKGRLDTSVPLKPPIEVPPNYQLNRIDPDSNRQPLKMYGATKQKTSHKSDSMERSSHERIREKPQRLQLPPEPSTSHAARSRRFRGARSRLASPQLLKGRLSPQIARDHASPLLLLPQPYSSLKKLLTSHLSIYNALTNPELDMSPHTSPHLPLSRATPDLKDPVLTFSPWQSITNDLDGPHDILGPYGFCDDFKDLRREFKSDFSPPLVKTTSILSVTTDEEGHISSSPKPNVMVFDTDEEEDFKGTSFIMPRLSVSENISRPKPFLITILTSSNTDTAQFVYNVKQHLSYIDIKHLVLNEKNNGKLHIKTSELIFVINDGLSIFVEFLGTLETYPKLTIINLMTVNYFINLFNLINNVQPYQIWKTPSLKETKLLDRIKNFVEIELSQVDQPEDAQDTSTIVLELKTLTMNLVNLSRSLYSNLIPQTKSNYKDIEKQYKSDLQGSTSFSDPLKISLNFSYIKILYVAMKKAISRDEEKYTANDSRFWVVCSFTVGMGLGIGIATGAASLIGFYVYQNLSKPPTAPPVIESRITPTKPVVELIIDRSKALQEYISSECQSFFDSDFASTITSSSMVCLESLRNIGSSVVVGFQKLVGLLTIAF